MDCSEVVNDGVSLAVHSVAGEGRGVVLLHGLTSTRKYVLMGSRLLEKEGLRIVSYDARGHGQSGAARDPNAYGYDYLASDLDAVVEQANLKLPLGIGISMGAHTLAAAAARVPDRFSGLLLITPAYLPGMQLGEAAGSRWRRLAEGLRVGGPEGFVAAGAVDEVAPKWRDVAERATLQRMAQHEHPGAVADALESVPWSVPFKDWAGLSELKIPVTVVGSQDGSDPGHPLSVAREWASQIPTAELVVEADGESPLAWRGAAISKLALELIS